jgi:hypothetical protein
MSVLIQPLSITNINSTLYINDRLVTKNAILPNKLHEVMKQNAVENHTCQTKSFASLKSFSVWQLGWLSYSWFSISYTGNLQESIKHVHSWLTIYLVYIVHCMEFFSNLFKLVLKEIIHGKEYWITKIISINNRHEFTNHEEKMKLWK